MNLSFRSPPLGLKSCQGGSSAACATASFVKGAVDVWCIMRVPWRMQQQVVEYLEMTAGSSSVSEYCCFLPLLTFVILTCRWFYICPWTGSQYDLHDFTCFLLIWFDWHVVMLFARQWNLPLPRRLKIWGWIRCFMKAWVQKSISHHVFFRVELVSSVCIKLLLQGQIKEKYYRAKSCVRHWAGTSAAMLWMSRTVQKGIAYTMYYHVWYHPCANFLFKIRWPKKLPCKNFTKYRLYMPIRRRALTFSYTEGPQF